MADFSSNESVSVDMETIYLGGKVWISFSFCLILLGVWGIFFFFFLNSWLVWEGGVELI